MKPTTDNIAKAARSYTQYRKDWEFLGYSETLAMAVLTEFFSLRRVRNPSDKPLNVLSMVGKRRVLVLKSALAEAMAPQPEDEQEGNSDNQDTETDESLT